MYPRLRALALTTAIVPLLAASATAHAAPDLDFLASAGLGDELGGRPVALDLSGDGVVLASERAGQGALVRLDRFGERTGPIRALAGGVDDVAVDRRSGNVVVLGEAGLAAFDPGFEPLWQRSLESGAGEDRELALGELGTVAALAGGALHIFSADGAALGRVDSTHEVARGVAVLDEAGVVVTTGWSRRPACGAEVDVASLAAFARDGAPRWRAYGDASEAELCGRHADPASTRGVAVRRGEDGLVYLLAEVEGRNDIFRGRAGEPDVDANNVGFDAYTDPQTAHPAQSAYFARFTAGGQHLLGQYFLLPAAGSQVRPRDIAADEHGNVYLTGAVSHSLGAANDFAITEALDRMAGFYQVVEPDFEARRVWELLDVDDMYTDITELALGPDRAVTLVIADAVDGRSEGSLPTGPSVIQWAGGHGPVAVEKRPDPETQGTFGFESGVSGSDPTCYCDSSSAPGPAALLGLAVFGLAGLRRPGRRRD